MMASLLGAVPDGVSYKYFKIFNSQDIHLDFGYHIFRVISLLPQLKMNSKTQNMDKLHGNYLIYNYFGPNEN